MKKTSVLISLVVLFLTLSSSVKSQELINPQALYAKLSVSAANHSRIKEDIEIYVKKQGATTYTRVLTHYAPASTSFPNFPYYTIAEDFFVEVGSLIRVRAATTGGTISEFGPITDNMGFLVTKQHNNISYVTFFNE